MSARSTQAEKGTVGSASRLGRRRFAARAIIDRACFPRFFAQDLRPQFAAELNAQQQPLNLPIVVTPSGPGAWHRLPSWYAVSGADLMIDPAEQRAMARRIGATAVEFDGASHAAGYTRYAARFITLIEEAAIATSG